MRRTDALRLVAALGAIEMALVRRDVVAGPLLAQAARAAAGRASRLGRRGRAAGPAPGVLRRHAPHARPAQGRPGAVPGSRRRRPRPRSWRPLREATVRLDGASLTSAVVRAQVEAANRRFYDAFEAKDRRRVGRMLGRRATTSRACIPGGPGSAGGRRFVRRGSSSSPTPGTSRSALEIVAIVVNDPVAIVSCIEHVTTARDGERVEASVAATNVFELRARRLAAGVHHASPIVRPDQRDERPANAPAAAAPDPDAATASGERAI